MLSGSVTNCTTTLTSGAPRNTPNSEQPVQRLSKKLLVHCAVVVSAFSVWNQTLLVLCVSVKATPLGGTSTCVTLLRANGGGHVPTCVPRHVDANRLKPLSTWNGTVSTVSVVSLDASAQKRAKRDMSTQPLAV